jgi:hypothetical protein
MNRIKLAQFGLGPIGIESIRLAAERPWAELVGAVDIDPQKHGKTVADLTGVAELRAAKVYPSFEALWAAARPQVVLHTAGSKAEESIRQIEPMIRHGVSVVSSCEELLFPQLRAPEAAKRLDELCRANGARVLGTGVNPGFVMDLLPVFLTGVSREVRRIYVERVVNASTRRKPLQQKIGSGLDPDEFRRLFQQGRAGHAGFRESVALIAHCMGWPLDGITETCEPVVADRDIQTAHFQVKKGLTCGLHQHAEGKVGGVSQIVLDLKMYLDAPDPHDLVKVDGDPPLEVLVRNGVAGDRATVAALVNAVPRILKASPGLLLVTDLAAPCWRSE